MVTLCLPSVRERGRTRPVEELAASTAHDHAFGSKVERGLLGASFAA
jgi:hypothetical protein